MIAPILLLVLIVSIILVPLVLYAIARRSPYSPEWDEKLNELMDKYAFTNIDQHTAKLGSVTVWISDCPYADFECYEPRINASPSRKTLKRARKELASYSARQMSKAIKSIP